MDNELVLGINGSAIRADTPRRADHAPKLWRTLMRVVKKHGGRRELATDANNPSASVAHTPATMCTVGILSRSGWSNTAYAYRRVEPAGVMRHCGCWVWKPGLE